MAEICDSCGMAIKECPDCGGKMCTEGCTDRMDDGCTCDKDDVDGDDETMDI